MTETKQEKKGLNLPDNFKKILLEVISPSQSTDYMTLGDICFPIQVLPIGAEKKFLRLTKTYESEKERLISLATGELCRYYQPELRINWAAENANEDDLYIYYTSHLKKMSYNDDVIDVVSQVIDAIEWKPIDEEKNEQFQVYLPAFIFSPVVQYLNMIEGKDIHDVFEKYTRGLLEIVKLNNMIVNDRTRPKETVKKKSVGDQMSKAQTADEYLSGLMGQGFDISSIL